MAARRRGAARGRTALALLLVAFLAGCTPRAAEPGLFGREPAPSSPAERPTVPPPTSPDVPVVGEATWTAAGVTYRVAVHAVRRLIGGSVLDWSVTPLPGPGLAVDDPVSGADLGLTRTGRPLPAVSLVDVSRRQVLRPLLHVASATCVCTPLPDAASRLRAGRTTLLQVAFPSPADDAATLDVVIATVPPFFDVPITPRGMVPLVSNPEHLGRPDVVTEPVSVRTLPDPGAGPRRRLVIRSVQAARTFTAVTWEVSGALAPVPELRVDGRVLLPRRATARQDGRDAQVCWCGSSSASATRVTVFPALPRGRSAVDVEWPDLATLRDVPVAAAPDAAFRSAGPAVRRVRYWRESAATLPPGWSDASWPTPVPSPGQLRAAQATVDRLLD